MKKVFVIIVVAVVALVALKLAQNRIGSGDLSPEERLVQSLDERIDAANRQIAQASRAAGVSGIDTTSDAESALRELERVESDIQSLKRKSTSAEVQRECDRLMSKVEATRR